MGAEFIAVEGVLKGLILALESGEEWTIGKDPNLCTIVIEDPKAARLHVRIRKTEAGYEVENLSDTAPAAINQNLLTAPTVLLEGDLLTIGTTTFQFYAEGAPFDYGFESESTFGSEEEAAPEEIEEEAEEEKVEEIFAEEPPAFEAPEHVETPLPEEPEPETLFEESDVPQLHIDLTQTTRFVLKVIAGPNTGAEFALELDHTYTIGTDTISCDIIFNDLSVSREHARLSVSPQGTITIQDLGSRNGVIVDKERAVGSKTLAANTVVSLGTSAFLLIDKEAPSETIAAHIFEMPPEEEEELTPAEPEGAAAEELTPAAKAPAKPLLPAGTLVLALIIGCFAVLFGIGLVSLFQTHEVSYERKDYLAEIQAIIKEYPAVRFTYSPSNGKLFLLGHVVDGVQHNELLYQLNGLGFLRGIDDNVVNDEAVWQEMNILLSKHPDFKGVSMHSPQPGVFVIGGYLQTEKQAAELVDYLNINFNYLSLLQNRVVVEESVKEEVNSRLAQQGFNAVSAALVGGDLQLTGYVGSNNLIAYEKFIEELKKMPGIRTVRNYVVAVTPEQGVIDLNRKLAEGVKRYHVTGFSKHGDLNVNVVINGRILSRGDCLDGFTITSIQPHAVFLERDGLKYKIEYNTCNSFRGE